MLKAREINCVKTYCILQGVMALSLHEQLGLFVMF